MNESGTGLKSESLSCVFIAKVGLLIPQMTHRRTVTASSNAWVICSDLNSAHSCRVVFKIGLKETKENMSRSSVMDLFRTKRADTCFRVMDFSFSTASLVQCVTRRNS